MKPPDLLNTAFVLLGSSRGRPTAASLRRAISSAYYALFHCLARECADLLIGGGGSARSERAWRQAYRALEHRHTAEKCQKRDMMKRFPKEIEDFGNAFITLQDKRHNADYDPFAKFTKLEATVDINLAKQAIDKFKSVDAKHRRAFCAYVLFKDRK